MGSFVFMLILEFFDSNENFYNMGNTFYKSKDYNKALGYFEKSSKSDLKKIAESSHYNLGNTYYKLGKLQDSLKSYEKVLSMNPKHEKAKKNLDFVKKKIKERQNIFVFLPN